MDFAIGYVSFWIPSTVVSIKVTPISIHAISPFVSAVPMSIPCSMSFRMALGMPSISRWTVGGLLIPHAAG